MDRRRDLSRPRSLPLLYLLLLSLLPCAWSADSAAASCGAGGAPGDSGFCSLPSDAESQPQARGSSITLWGTPTSSNTRRVLLALLEKGLTDFKFEMLNLRMQEQKDSAYMEKQPFGQVPALSDDGFTVFESRAVARYIAEKYESQGTALFGSNFKERSLVNVWMEVESQEFNPHAAIVAFELVIGPRMGLIPNETRAHEAAEKLERVFDVYEERLETHQFLAGNFVSLADLNHIPYASLLWPAGYGRLVEDRSNVFRWWKEISSRKSWLRIVEGFP